MQVGRSAYIHQNMTHPKSGSKVRNNDFPLHMYYYLNINRHNIQLVHKSAVKFGTSVHTFISVMFISFYTFITIKYHNSILKILDVPWRSIVLSKSHCILTVMKMMMHTSARISWWVMAVWSLTGSLFQPFSDSAPQSRTCLSPGSAQTNSRIELHRRRKETKPWPSSSSLELNIIKHRKYNTSTIKTKIKQEVLGRM